LRRKSKILSVDHRAWLAFHVIAASHPFIASGIEIEIREGPKPPRADGSATDEASGKARTEITFGEMRSFGVRGLGTCPLLDSYQSGLRKEIFGHVARPVDPCLKWALPPSRSSVCGCAEAA
jgi:hypothetical protein